MDILDQEAEEDEDLGPDAGLVRPGVHAEGFEGGEHDEHGSPAVVEREGEVDQDLVGRVRGLVVLLDDVVDVRHSGGDEECEDESCVKWQCEVDFCDCG